MRDKKKRYIKRSYCVSQRFMRKWNYRFNVSRIIDSFCVLTYTSLQVNIFRCLASFRRRHYFRRCNVSSYFSIIRFHKIVSDQLTVKTNFFPSAILCLELNCNHGTSSQHNPRAFQDGHGPKFHNCCDFLILSCIKGIIIMFQQH